MRRIFIVLLLITVLSPAAGVYAQTEIPLGTWRMHTSFNQLKSLAVTQDKVYAAATNGILVFDREDKSTEIINKLNGLGGSAITRIAFDETTQQLLVAYEDGTFDAAKGNEFRNFDPARNTVITGSKTIHGITIEGSLAYFATTYGVLVFDLVRSEIKETWRNIGPDGTRFTIYESTIAGDSIFLATENGILSGDMEDNLLDFNSWKRDNTDILDNEVKTITTFNGRVIAGIDGQGLYAWSGNGNWTKEPYLDGASFQQVNSSATHLLIASGSTAWLVDDTFLITTFEGDNISTILDIAEDEQGKIWLGDEGHGLITDYTGTFTTILPNGPSTDLVSDLRFAQGKLWKTRGGYTNSFTPQGNSGTIDIYEDGQWNSTTENVNDLVATDFADNGDSYFGSFGYGLLKRSGDVATVYDESNSTLTTAIPAERRVDVSALLYSTDGLWVTNFDAAAPLHLFKNDNTWEAFSFPIAASRYPIGLAIDYENNVWMNLAHDQGGGILVFKKDESDYRYLTVSAGSGELPSNAVNIMKLDRDQYMWVGTDQGLVYFFDEESAAVRPIFENRFLLRDDKVTAIAIDGGNRKWIGTNRGVWLFNPTGEVAVSNFTAANSPILSDKVVDIEINPVSGEVFIATDRGLVSFRNDATESRSSFQPVKIFPNPVDGNFTGLVGITGLATDAIVKIADVSGRRVWESQANGGTASWNVRDEKGKRVSSGIYLVFAINTDGTESIVGKIAVVN